MQLADKSGELFRDGDLNGHLPERLMRQNFARSKLKP
jgi:hypothetical protein